jgi:RNA polymerase sigma factor (sigma-70 family)
MKGQPARKPVSLHVDNTSFSADCCSQIESRFPGQQCGASSEDFDRSGDEFLARWDKELLPQVLRTIRACGVPEHDVEFVAQGVCIKEWWRRASGWAPPRSVEAWLTTVAKNEATDYMRWLRAQTKCLESLQTSGSGRKEFDERAERHSEATKDLVEAVRMAIESLSEPDQWLYRYRFVEEWKLRRIAADLQISVPAVRKRLVRIYERLQRMLKELDGDRFGQAE